MYEKEVIFRFLIANESGEWFVKDAGAIGNLIRRPMRWVSEQMFSGYQQQMEKLREIDSQIRVWTKDLDGLVDKAVNSRKLGKPLDVIFWLSQINNRLKLVGDKKKELSDIQDQHIEEYYGDTEQGIPDDYFQFGENKIVEAGFLDNLKRKMTTTNVERMYRKRLLEQSRSLVALLNLAKSTVNRVNTLLDQMESSRNAGDISLYIDCLDKIADQQNRFDGQFR